MSEQLPKDIEVLTDLMRNPVDTRVVTILDIVSLSILDLLEYGTTTKDINYVMANGVIQFAKMSPKVGEDYYYDFLNGKVMLTEIGLYILDSVKCDQVNYKSPQA